MRWKLAVALLVGVGLGLALPFGLRMFNANRDVETFALRGEVPVAGPGFDLALRQSVGLAPVGGHAIALLDDGAVFDAVVADLGRARRSMHVSMYIWESGVASARVTAALIARARAGVACRIVVDAFGSPDFAATIQPGLVRAGCEVHDFRPLPGVDPLARNHRKLVVVDGEVAITGGFGVRDSWLGDGVETGGRWRDANVRIAGPAVRDAQQAFAEHWQEAGGALLPADAFPAIAEAGSVRAAFVASTGAPVVTRAERLTQLAIASARRRLWIANAYFVPSPAILALIEQRAAAGVDVRLLVPGALSDSKPALARQHTHYPRLRKAGVRIWEYAPSMMHAKTMVTDDQLSVIGSINLDPLSLNKLDEAALVVDDRGIADQLARRFTADCERAREQP